MNPSESRRRVLIALTESSSLGALWRAAIEMLEEPDTELMALFVSDNRWIRAASLPFTREISLLGGQMHEFTRQRAEQLQRQAVTRIRQGLEQLASEAQLALSFEVLLDTELGRVEQLAQGAHDVLVVPAQFTASPVLAVFERLQCRIVFVQADEDLVKPPARRGR